MAAAIANFLIILWIFLYIATIYDNHSVAIERKLGLGPKREYIDTGSGADVSQAGA